jgi:hypothetical protein
LTTLSRDSATGTLTRPSGLAGCISALPGSHSCGARGLSAGSTVALLVAPDGRTVYALVEDDGGSELVSFRRATGSDAMFRSGCIAERGRGGCSRSAAGFEPNDFALSPDGADIYATTSGFGFPGSVSILRLGRDGKPAPVQGRAGCLSVNGHWCQKAPSLLGARSIAVAADGRDVYVGGVGITELARHPGSGLLNHRQGKGGCLSDSLPICTDVCGLDFVAGLATTPGGSVYATTPAGRIEVMNPSPARACG